MQADAEQEPGKEALVAVGHHIAAQVGQASGKMVQAAPGGSGSALEPDVLSVVFVPQAKFDRSPVSVVPPSAAVVQEEQVAAPVG
jgi:hypothetical protein